jgi:hypothetical protein
MTLEFRCVNANDTKGEKQRGIEEKPTLEAFETISLKTNLLYAAKASDDDTEHAIYLHLESKCLNPAHVLLPNNRHICRLLVQGCVPQ